MKNYIEAIMDISGIADRDKFKKVWKVLDSCGMIKTRNKDEIYGSDVSAVQKILDIFR